MAGRRHVGIIAIEAVGNYAVRLTFDDLHDTGIYSWEYLHKLGQEQAAIWARLSVGPGGPRPQPRSELSLAGLTAAQG